jgi:hypothetical protein
VVCLSESWNGEDIWILISLRERERERWRGEGCKKQRTMGKATYTSKAKW